MQRCCWKRPQSKTSSSESKDNADNTIVQPLKEHLKSTGKDTSNGTITTKTLKVEPPMKMPMDSASKTNAVLTVPQTKVFPTDTTNTKSSSNENKEKSKERSIFEQLKDAEKIAAQCKAEALALKNAGDVKGAVSETIRIQKIASRVSIQTQG